MRTWPIPQVALVVVVVLFAAVAAASVLTLANFSRALEETVESRFQFVGRELRDSVETGLNLGLALNELTNVQQIVDDRAARDAAILRIVVRDARGEALFAAGAGATGARASGVEEAQVVETLVNSFGQTVGSVEIGYAVGTYASAIDEVREALLRYGLVLAAIGGLAATVGVALVLQRLPRTLRRVRARFADAAADGATESPLEAQTATAVATLNTANRQLEALAQQVSGEHEAGASTSAEASR